MVVCPMRLILLIPLLVFLPQALADVEDVYIPQCDRARDRCIKGASKTAAVEQCRKSREACRTATINEAIKSSGMSATELFGGPSPRR